MVILEKSLGTRSLPIFERGTEAHYSISDHSCRLRAYC